MKNPLPPATGNLRAIQLRMLEILVEIDKICRKNNICYWITAGTLLGAVRHGGFIPWDDDIDICVPHRDFQRFQEVCLEQLPEWLYLQNKQTDPQSYIVGGGLVKIRDKNSIVVESNDTFKVNYQKGIYIDIFECVNSAKIPDRIYHYLMRRVSCACWFYCEPRLLNIWNIGRYILYPFSLAIHYPILRLLMCLGKKNYYGLTPNRYDTGYQRSEETIYPCREIEFEGYKFMGPNDPDQYLKRCYGDYMQIPPEDKRMTHLVLGVLDKTEVEIQYESNETV